MVDDSDTERRIIGGMLRKIGFLNINEASDGKEALAMLHEKSYD